MLSIQVDRKYTKDQILEMYLNDVPYGGAAIGVQAASQLYLIKTLKIWIWRRAHSFPVCRKAPALFAFYRRQILHSKNPSKFWTPWSEMAIYTKTGRQRSKRNYNTQFAQNSLGIKAPHFVFYVKQQLINQFGEQVVESGGLRVKTTLDYNIEKKAEDIVKTEVAGDKNLNVGNGAAMVTIPKTGEILAMVGSEDYFDTKKRR